MSIRRTSAPPRPPSPSRASSSTGSAEGTSASAPARPSSRRRNSSVFETGNLPRTSRDEARARDSAGAVPSRPAAVSVRTPPNLTSNAFTSKVGGRYPPVAAGGFLTQLKQSAATAQLALSAAESVLTGGSRPPDFAVASKLRSLSVTDLTSDSDKVTQADYFSQIAGVKPDQVYDYFLNNPGAIFGSADIKVRPATGKLRDGQRLMLEQAGTPSVWFPIEVRLDPAKKQINIATLDGHPLRGTNQFTFADDGQGGTRVNQLTRYQLSSKAVQLGMGADDLQRQHNTWEQAHKSLFEHFHPRS